MAWLDNLLSIPGAQGWLSGLLQQPGGQGIDPQLLQSMNTGGYSLANANPSLNDRFSAVNDRPLSAMPLPPPIPIPQPRPQFEAQAAAPPQAQLPPNAQPTGPAQSVIPQQPAMPQPQAPAPGAPQIGGGGFLGTLGTILAPNITGRLQASQAQQQLVNGTYQALLPRLGHDKAAAIAMGVIANPKLGEAILPQALGLNPPPTTIEGAIARQIEDARNGVPGSGGAAGVANALKLQSMVTANKAAAEAQGKDQGTRSVELPQALASADQTIKEIDQLLAHPGMKSAVGPIAGRAPAIAGEQADYIARLDQLTAQGMAQTIQSLRGAGLRITQGEVNQGQKAFARASRIVDVKDHIAALNDVRDWMVGLRTRAGEMAGVGPTPPEQSSAAPSFSQDSLLAEARRRGLVK